LKGVYENRPDDKTTLVSDDVMKILGSLVPKARARPAAPAWSVISDEIQQQVYAAYTGQRTPELAVTAIREFLQRLVAAGLR